MVSIAQKEQEKYKEVWQLPGYDKNSPGEDWADLFAEISGCQEGETLIDAGCGIGAAGKKLRAAYGLDVTFMDMNQGDLKEDTFVEGCIWHKDWVEWGPWKYAYCCDVMEHLPQEFTMLSLDRLLHAADWVFLSISFNPDNFGKYIGQPLHLTVQPFSWWRDAIREIADVCEARDLMGEGIFHLERKLT